MRALLRLVVVVVILAAVAAFFFGYRLGDNGIEGPVTQSGPTVNTERAREAGARIGQTVANGAARAQQALSESALTAKIKSKMALDDSVKALSIDVDTTGTVVTLSGAVSSETERAKAVQLARDTDGVTAVTDRLVIR